MRLIAIFLGLFAFINLAFAENYHSKMNDVEVYIISLGKRDAPVSKLIPNNDNDKKLIEKSAQNPRQNEHNVMLLKHQNFIALVDTGFENTIPTLKGELEKLGIKFDDITHVIITHGHMDHIGGILSNRQNNFPQATLMIDKIEDDFWQKSDNQNAKNALNAFKNKQYFNHQKPLLDSKLIIKSIAAYGHTPGHNMISLENGKDKLIFIGDLIHFYDLQIKNPKIAIEYDNDPKTAIKTREKLLKEFKADKAKIIGVHLPFTSPVIVK